MTCLTTVCATRSATVGNPEDPLASISSECRQREQAAGSRRLNSFDCKGCPSKLLQALFRRRLRHHHWTAPADMSRTGCVPVQGIALDLPPTLTTTPLERSRSEWFGTHS